MFNEQQLDQIWKIVEKMMRQQPRQKIVQSDIKPQTIKRGHIEDVVIVFGLAADRPTSGLEGDIRAYFETDTGVLGCWDGTQWLETTLV